MTILIDRESNFIIYLIYNNFFPMNKFHKVTTFKLKIVHQQAYKKYENQWYVVILASLVISGSVDEKPLNSQ